MHRGHNIALTPEYWSCHVLHVVSVFTPIIVMVIDASSTMLSPRSLLPFALGTRTWPLRQIIATPA